MLCDSEIVKIWSSPKDASDELGLSIQKIRYICRKSDINKRLMYKIYYEK